MLVEVVGTEVAVGFTPGEHIVGNNEDGMGQGDLRFLGATPRRYPAVLCADIRLLAARSRMGGFDQGLTEPRASLPRPSPLAFAGALVITGAEARSRREMARAWEAAHVGADLRDEDLGDTAAHARDRVQQI